MSATSAAAGCSAPGDRLASWPPAARRTRASSMPKAAGRRPAQRGEMRAAPERLADVLGEHANVGALAALDRDDGVGWLPVDEVERVHDDRARRCAARPRRRARSVQRPAVELERRVASAASARAGRRSAPASPRDRPARNSTGRVARTSPSASPVVVVAPKRIVATIALRRVEQALRELGRLAEAQRQQARRERIERAGVAGLLRAIQPPRPLQRGVRRHARSACRAAARRRRGARCATAAFDSASDRSRLGAHSLPEMLAFCPPRPPRR